MCPILIDFGFVTIYWYGVTVAVSILVSIFLIHRQNGLSKEDAYVIDNVIICALFFGILGARLLHVFQNWQYYSISPNEIVAIHKGGLAIQGGIFLGFVSSLFYLILRNKLKLADLIMPYLALSQAIGRIGCFLNGCCYGIECDAFFCVKFPNLTAKVLPVQFFYSFLFLALFFLLRKIYKKQIFRFQTLILYFVFDGTLRFFLDFLRGDLESVVFGLKLSQIVALVTILIFSIVYVLLWRIWKRQTKLS